MSGTEQVRNRTTARDKTKSGRRETFQVVGIGASAGGLEAFTALLKALPAHLGMAYVFVPHLDPSRANALVEILSRAPRCRSTRLRTEPK